MNITMRVTMARAEMATVTYSTGVMMVSLLFGSEVAQFGRQGRAVGFGGGGQRHQLAAAVLGGVLRDPAAVGCIQLDREVADLAEAVCKLLAQTFLLRLGDRCDAHGILR